MAAFDGGHQVLQLLHGVRAEPPVAYVVELRATGCLVLGHGLEYNG